MAITFVDSEVVNVTTAGTTIVFTASNITGLADDDYMIFQVCHAEAEDGDWTGTPGGLTSLIGELQVGETPPSIPGLSVWAKFASSESGTYTFTTDFSSGMTGTLSVYRGVDQTTPQDATATTSISTSAGSINPAAITTVTDDAWVITMGFIDATAITGVPTNYTTRGLGTTGAGGNGCSLECADDEIASFGSEDPGTYTNTSEQWGCVTMALRPAPEGITAVTPSEFDIDNTDIDIDSGALFGASIGASDVYLSCYPTLADNGAMGEVDITAAVTVWGASQITLDLTDLSAATIDELHTRILPRFTGLQYYIIVNVGGVPGTTEYNSPVTLHRSQAIEMVLGSIVPGTTTSRLTGMTGTFGGGRAEETAAQNPSTTTTNVADDGRREDVWSMQLKPNARATRPANYLDLPGTTSNSATIPDSATLDLTQTFWGYFEVELDDWTPTGGAVICSKWITSGNLRSFSFSVNSSGNLVMQYSTNGTAESTFTSSVATGFTDGTKHWIGFLAVSGSTFFQTSEDGDIWTNLGTSQGGETSIFNTSAAVELGAEDSGTTGLWSGKFYQAQLKEADGTMVMWANFRDVAADDTSFPEGINGATVTVNQNSSPQAEVVAGTESVIYDFESFIGGNALNTLTTTPQLNVSAGVEVVATTDALVITEQTATITLDVDVSATTDALVIAEQTATVNAETNINATTDALVIAEEVIALPVTTHLDTLAITTFPATINAATNITATTDPLVIAEQLATIALGVIVDATTDALVITTQQATVNAETNINATTDALVITELTPALPVTSTILDELVLTEFPATVSLGIDVQATTDALVITELPATVSLDIDIQATTDPLIITELQASAQLNKFIIATTDVLNIATFIPTLPVTSTIVDALVITELQASIAAGSGVQATTDVLIIDEQQATVNAEINITATTDALVIAEQAATVNAATGIDATTDALVIAEQQATVNAEQNIQATTESLILSEQPATISLDVDITATTDALVIAEQTATVSLGVNISATTYALILTELQASIGVDTEVLASTDALLLTELAATVSLVVVGGISTGGFLSPAQAARIARFQEEEQVPVFTREEFEEKFLGGRRKANRVIVNEVQTAVEVVKGPSADLEKQVDSLLSKFTLDTGQVHFEAIARDKKALAELRALEAEQILVDDEEFTILLSLV